MKLYSPDKSTLMEVRTVKDHPEGLVVEGKIMGAMPMKAIVRPEEMRAALKLLSFRIVLKVIGMLLRGGKPPARPKA